MTAEDGKLVLRIYDASIPRGEHRALRQAITDAIKAEKITYVDVSEGKAAIVPLCVVEDYFTER
jgi:hypothetical protein